MTLWFDKSGVKELHVNPRQGPGRERARWREEVVRVTRSVLSPSLRLLSPPPEKRPRSRLVLFPYAGAGAYIFRTWVSRLPDDVEIVGVQLPGREDRFHEDPVDDLDAVVEAVTAELTDALEPLDDWFVFGHSLGAVLAAEVARNLTDVRTWGPPAHVMVSGSRALHLVHRNRLPVHQLTDDELVEHVRSLNGTPEEILSEATIMEPLLRLLRADYSLFDQYEHTGSTPLASPVTVFAGDSDPSTSPDTLDAWSLLTTGTCQVHTLPGDHFFLNQSRTLLLRLVNDVLRQSRAARP
jgi:medium-chain acyl-[acyl-carrier-protein] hydrolase